MLSGKPLNVAEETFWYMRDYYPITLVKTSDFHPQKNYILDIIPMELLPKVHR